MGHHLRIAGRLVEQFDDRHETLVGVVQEDVSGTDGIENGTGFLDGLWRSRLERYELQVRAFYQIRDLHQQYQVDRAGETVQVRLAQPKLGEQEFRHGLWAVFRDFETNRIAEVALRQFALDARPQVLDFFLVNEEIAVAGHPELVAAEYVHAREQFADELM